MKCLVGSKSLVNLAVIFVLQQRPYQTFCRNTVALGPVSGVRLTGHCLPWALPCSPELWELRAVRRGGRAVTADTAAAWSPQDPQGTLRLVPVQAHLSLDFLSA